MNARSGTLSEMPILVRAGQANSVLRSSKFVAEQDLEEILRDCPELLCDDDQEQRPNIHRIAFVARQVRLPEAGILDLLFVTADGLPVAVEVKLGRNAESRRQVIAQVMDYASDLTGLTVDELDILVAGRLEQALYALTVDGDTSFDVLWGNVGANLRAGKAKLIVAVDESTPSLERIFHFLTRASNLDVDLIAVQSYDSQVGRIVVPRRRVSSRIEQNPPSAVEGTERSGPRTAADSRVITVLVQDNPKRPGSAARERFKLYRTGMTVEQFLTEGGTKADIWWDEKHGFIALSPGE